MVTHAPAPTRPPGPQLGPLELARLLRRRRITELLERASRQAPELAHFRMGFEHAYLVSTPELVRELFGPLGRVTAKGRGLEQARLLLGDGLLTSEGDLHRRQRRLIQPAFHHPQIRAYARVMAEEAARLPARGDWTDGGTRDVAADMAAVTLRIVGRTLFTTDLSADASAVTEAATRLIHLHARSLSVSRRMLGRLPLPGRRAGEAAAAELDRVVQRMVTESR